MELSGSSRLRSPTLLFPICCVLRAILNKSWQQHPTRHQLYGHLPPITKTIQVRRTRHAGHCWRSRDELIRDVLLWIPTHGRAKAGRPARTYIQQLCEDTGCCPEDLPRAMNDREEWRKRVRDIRAASTIWWWWWYYPLCTYTHKHTLTYTHTHTHTHIYIRGSFNELGKFFWRSNFKMAADQTKCHRFERRFIINFFRCCDMQTILNLQKNVLCVGKSIFLSKTIFAKYINICWPLRAWIEKIVNAAKTKWLSGKEKLLGSVVRK